MQVEAMRAAANALKLELQVTRGTDRQRSSGNAFAAMAQGRIEAIVVSTDTLFRANYIEIADLAGKQRLPRPGQRSLRQRAVLIGYGVDDAEMYRHAAYFVDRILKGAKPGDLPDRAGDEVRAR